MSDHDRYQTHCRFCYRMLEGDSAAEAVQKAEEHEKECDLSKRIVEKKQP